MFSVRNQLICAIAGLGALGLANAAEAAIVVSSSGPSAGEFPKGRQLDDDTRITLQSGDRITILDERGTRVLRGSGTFTIGNTSAPSQNGKFSILTRQRSATRVRTGAVRTGEAVAPLANPNLWYVDIARSGTVCLASTEDIRFWRAGAQSAANYDLTIAGESAALSFGEGDIIAALPDGIDAGPGNVSIAGPGLAQPTQISLVTLSETPASPQELARILIENGCEIQLDVLSTTLAMETPEEAADS